MESQAIERIEQLAAASQTLPDTDTPAVILPGGASVEALDRLMDAPRQMRQTFKTERLEDFCRYVKQEAQAEQTAVFVAPNGSGAAAVIDFGSHTRPLWGRHRSSLEMKHTPEFRALVDVCDRALSQRDVTDYLEDWAHTLTAFRGEERLSLAKTLAAIRRVEIKAQKESRHDEGDWSAARSSMEQVEASSGGQAMPDGFRLHCQVYPCTKPRNVTVRMSLLTGDDKPRLRLRILGYDRLMKEIAEEVELEISSRLTATRVFVGSV